MDEWSWKHHVLAIFVTIFPGLLLLLLLRRRRLRLPPGPLSLPVIGHLHLIKPPLHHFLHGLAARYGPLLRLRLGSTLCIVASSPDTAMAELINHPDHLIRLRQEIEQVVGMRRVIDESDLESLPFLQAVVKETLRLHPPGPLIYRRSSEDVRVRGYEIPAGVTVIVNVWAVGRDSGYWEEAEEFRPERFEAAEVDVRGQDFQMLPFGSGRRGCPGMMLALQVVPVTLAAMVQCFEWEVVGGARRSNREDGDEKDGEDDGRRGL